MIQLAVLDTTIDSTSLIRQRSQIIPNNIYIPD
jgi:hypothetical protein